MPEPRNREREVFNAALEQASSAERAGFLDQACGGDVGLRMRVEELLRAHERIGEFLDRGESADPAGADTESPVREGPGKRIGRYKLLEQIGEGGFGVVYMAEQEEPVRRRVALKIIKLGMDTRAVVARFEAERQALALMDHPNIARVFDGGATETGRPYFVMELVRGIPITRYCDERRLATRERIDLFLLVCHAVQHAHQKGIIHRDLKPSNILVTQHDDRPVPKVIDFGIAKAIEQRLTEKTFFTRFHQFIGTPAYMSPEQAGSGGLDIDTRSDIYSLGVLLYELLTGQTPLDIDKLLAAGFEEIHRAIRETEPFAPSQRLTSLSREEQTAAAQRRGLNPTRLTSQLRGDLDRIVMQCLEKDRTRRYETANGLAMDIRRHLQNEPVLARAATPAYRLAKFVRRHRTPVAFGALILSAMTAGMVGTITQARRATRQAVLAEGERIRADKEARVAKEDRDFALRQLSRAEAIDDLNSFLLSDAAPAGKPFTVDALLSRAEELLDRQHADTDENRIEILIALGRQYQVQDEQGKARKLLGRAYELSRQVSDRSVRAKAASAFAHAIAQAGEFDRAEALIRESLNELGNERQFDLTRVFCLLRASAVAQEDGNVQAGLARALQAQRLLRESPTPSAAMSLRVSMDVADSLRMADRPRQAVDAFKDAFSQLSALGRDNTETAGTLLNNWALTLSDLGRPLEAEPLFRQAIAISSADASERSVSPMLLNNQARNLFALHRLSEAAGYVDRAYTTAQSAHDEVVVNQSLIVRASIFCEQGNLDRAAAALAELEPRFKQMLPSGHIAFAVLASLQSKLTLARGDAATALLQSDQAVAIAETNAQRLGYLPNALLRRSDVEFRLQRFAAARADAEKALGIERGKVGAGEYSSEIGRAYLRLGRALSALGKSDDARTALAAALDHLQSSLGAEHPETQEAAQGSRL